MRRSGILLATIVLVAAACTTADESNDESNEATTTQPTTTTTEAPTTTTQSEPAGGLVVTDSSLGSILVDGDGNTLYLFTPDNQGESVCYDQCEAAWPPLVDPIEAGDGINASLLGTAPRNDGSEQITYNGWPLYYFANDNAPGDTNGQGINDVWYVLSPDGSAIGMDISAGGLVVTDSSLGSILVDGDGNTLYLFTPDNQGESVCYDQCEAAWPPLVDPIEAGDGINASLLGTAPRNDGSEQITYNGWPLYYFANDNAPGDTNGQGINDVWYVLSPDGNAIGIDG